MFSLIILCAVRQGWLHCSWRGISKSRGWRTGGPHADSSLPVRSFNYHIISFYRRGAWRRAANEGGWSHAELRAFLNWCQQLKRGDECEVKWLRMWFNPRSSLLRSLLALIFFLFSFLTGHFFCRARIIFWTWHWLCDEPTTVNILTYPAMFIWHWIFGLLFFFADDENTNSKPYEDKASQLKVQLVYLVNAAAAVQQSGILFPTVLWLYIHILGIKKIVREGQNTEERARSLLWFSCAHTINMLVFHVQQISCSANLTLCWTTQIIQPQTKRDWSHF